MTDDDHPAGSGTVTLRAKAPPDDAAPATREWPEPPEPAGPAEAHALRRTQLRIALGTCALVMTVLTGLPVLLALVPEIARARVHGVPLCWLVLALGVQPVWVAAARWQLSRAERAERDLMRPVGRP